MFSLENEAQVSLSQQSARGSLIRQVSWASQEDEKGYGCIHLFMLTAGYEYITSKFY
jgi:hypothetical protein